MKGEMKTASPMHGRRAFGMLAVVLAVAFVALAAIPAVDAGDSDATVATGVYYVGGEGANDDNAGTSAAPFATIQKAIDVDAEKIVLNGDIKLADNVAVTADGISVTSDKTLEIDLNGHTISYITTNTTGTAYYAIRNAGTLTVSDSSEAATGGIIVQGYPIGVFGNLGTLTINGGTFETKAINTTDGKKVFYLLNNNKDITINGGVFKSENSPGVNSSVVKNGWFDPSQTSTAHNNDLVVWTDEKTATMTIDNATFKTKNYIKNDSYGELTINSGSFTMEGSACVLSYEKLTINGGTFNNTNAAGREPVWAYNGADVTITGGTFTSAYDAAVRVSTMGEYTTKVTINTDKVKVDAGDALIKAVLETEKIKNDPVEKIVDRPITADITIIGNKVELKSILPGDGGILIKAGSVEITGPMDASTANAQITGATGDVVLKDVTITSGALTLDKNITVEGTLTVKTGAELTVNTGATLTSNGTIVMESPNAKITNNGTVNLNMENNSTDIVNGGKVGSSSAALGLNEILDANLTITNKAFLEKDLIVKEGFTLTVDNNAALQLNGKKLIVYGTLVVKNNGAVYGEGSILLSKTGVIDNSGIIGKNLPVTVGLDTSLNNNTTSIVYGAGSVAIANASGMKFDLVKTVKDKVHYDLAVSGNVSKKGTSGNATVVISNEVLVKGDLSIGNGVTVTANAGAKLELLKSSSLDVTSKGAIGTKDAAVSIFMDAGSVFDINGFANVTVSALTGSVKTTEIGKSGVAVGQTTVTVKNVKGIILEAKSQAAYDSTVKADVTEYRLYVSGSMGIFDKNVTGTAFNVAKSTVAANTVTPYYGIFVDGTLAVSKDMIESTPSYYGIAADAQVTVNGTIVFEKEYNLDADAVKKAYIGAGYDLVSANADGVKITNTYITSFDAAFAKIADVKDKTIYTYGPVEISTEIALEADQYILGTAEFTITENGKMTVGNDATFNCKSVNVQGILVKMSDGSMTVNGEFTYSAMTKDDEGNITYSGFIVAIKNAKEGDIIEISQETKVESSFTIPAGVTVKIIGEGDLILGTDQKPADLTVDGTLINKNKLTVTGKTAVNGVMDLTEAASSNLQTDNDKSPITVTGKIVMASAYSEQNMNAVQYIDDDNQYVYTTLAKAVEAVSKMDVGRTVNQIGNVSDSTAVTLEGITLNVNGTATFGNIELVNSSVVVTGTLTATITGKTGEDGSTAASEIALAKVHNMTVACGSAPNSKNVIVWSVNVTPAAEAKGAVTFSKGEANLNTTTLGAVLKVLVSDGATVTIPKDNTVTVDALNENASALIVNGVLNVKGSLTVDALVKIAGTMNVTGIVNVNKALAVTGTLAVSEKEDAKGTVNVKSTNSGSDLVPGFIAVGAQPETLGAAGAVTGPIALDKGYVKVYSGATVETSKIALNGTESDAKKTVFNINGFDYMTVYAKSDVKISDVLAAEEFNLVGYITKIEGPASDAVSINDVTTWFSDADMTKKLTDGAIGTPEAVYYKAQPAKVAVKVSVGTGISMYIDGIKVTSGIDLTLAVGKHNVSAIVDPGFKGTVKTFFNGAEVTGSFTITPDMASASYSGTLSVSATGDITADSTVIVDSGDNGDDGMSLTDILLIVLVVLIAVMAIMVALRMMRS